MFVAYIILSLVVTKEQGRKAFSFSRYRAKEINEKENQQKKEQKRKAHYITSAQVRKSGTTFFKIVVPLLSRSTEVYK